MREVRGDDLRAVSVSGMVAGVRSAAVPVLDAGVRSTLENAMTDPRNPWDELADAQTRLEDAERVGDPAARDRARKDVAECREMCGLLGGLLILLACEHATEPLQKLMQRMFNHETSVSYGMARRAARIAEESHLRIQVLGDRVTALERELERLRDIDGIGPRPAERRRAGVVCTTLGTAPRLHPTGEGKSPSPNGLTAGSAQAH